MRVIHIGNLALPPDHPDHGRIARHPGRWVLDLAVAQKRHEGMNVEIVVNAPGTRANFVTECDGVRVHFLSGPNRFRAASLFAFEKRRVGVYVRGLRPDLVHAHGTEDSNALAALESGAPMLVTLQGCYFIINAQLPPKWLSRARLVEWTERLALSRTRVAIAKSDYIASRVKAGFPALEILRIPNTFDEALLEIPPSPREDAIAFVGSLDPRKGVDILADALEIMEKRPPRAESVPLALHVFGDRPHGPSGYEIEQKQRLSGLLGNRVIFHGTIPRLEVARNVARMRAVVAPSREEMFGNQLIEALLVQTPVVVTGDTALAENVRRFGNGTIVPQNDPVALAEAIRGILDGNLSAPQSESGECPGLLAKKRVIDFMGPAVVARLHRAAYEKVLQGARN